MHFQALNRYQPNEKRRAARRENTNEISDFIKLSGNQAHSNETLENEFDKTIS